jgi:threonine-phosphate decarboxylase
LQEELIKHIDDICRYPTPQARYFRAALAGYLGLPEEQLLIGNGANELIHLFFLWRRPRRALIPCPAFSEYARAARLAGAEVEYFSLPLEAAFDKSCVDRRLVAADLLVCCSPNNPTGYLYHGEALREIIKEAGEKGVTVLLDESFLPLTGKATAKSMATAGYDNLWVVASLTKLWALPGLRLGYLCGPREEVKSLTQNGDPWRVNALAQRAGLYCLAAEGYLEESVALIKREREYLIEHLQEMREISVFPGEANFLLLKGEKDGFSSAALCHKLASRGILIRNAANYPGLDNRYFRIAVLQRGKNGRLLEELHNFFASC